MGTILHLRRRLSRLLRRASFTASRSAVGIRSTVELAQPLPLSRGAVACERPKTKEVDDEEGLLTVMFYGDANPVRAGIDCHPKSYRWSSYQFYA
jgi:hypothetical protein